MNTVRTWPPKWTERMNEWTVNDSSDIYTIYHTFVKSLLIFMLSATATTITMTDNHVYQRIFSYLLNAIVYNAINNNTRTAVYRSILFMADIPMSPHILCSICARIWGANYIYIIYWKLKPFKICRKSISYATGKVEGSRCRWRSSSVQMLNVSDRRCKQTKAATSCHECLWHYQSDEFPNRILRN